MNWLLLWEEHNWEIFIFNEFNKQFNLLSIWWTESWVHLINEKFVNYLINQDKELYLFEFKDWKFYWKYENHLRNNKVHLFVNYDEVKEWIQKLIIEYENRAFALKELDKKYSELTEEDKDKFWLKEIYCFFEEYDLLYLYEIDWIKNKFFENYLNWLLKEVWISTFIQIRSFYRKWIEEKDSCLFDFIFSWKKNHEPLNEVQFNWKWDFLFNWKKRIQLLK